MAAVRFRQSAMEYQQLEPLPLSGIPAILPMDPDVCEEDDDIYRGLPDDQPPPVVISILSPPPRPESSTSGSSSSSSYSVSGRLGVLAAVVEQAISRWARRNSSSSSLTTSTSSSASRFAPSIQTKSTRKRRRRHSADHNARSERDIIARIRVREETRRIPRGFSLYVPQQLRTLRASTSASDPALQFDQQGVLRTHLLPAVLNRVQHALRLSEKLRQPERVIQGDSRTPTIETAIDSVSASPLMTHDRDRRKEGKGKQRDLNRTPRERVPRPIPGGVVDSEKRSWPSWWLDISSPTYADMRALGKLLHLHPLTLEDILQQDPREKMELFPKLGYYFIVFKAVESERTRDRLDRLARQSVNSLPNTNTGVIAEDLIYLVVLRDGRGICTFHFTDISEHIDRVREKVLLLKENTKKSSDWIAHGVLDSVVDSFFPFVAQIGKEVDQIEKLLYSDSDDSKDAAKANSTKPKPPTGPASGFVDEKGDDTPPSPHNEKPPLSPSKPQQHVKTAMFQVTPLPISLHIRRARRFLKSMSSKTSKGADVGEPWRTQQANTATRTVYKMVKIRRLVTSLTRLLSTKADVIGQIRKRLLTRGEWSLDSDPELHIHLGDILDHILSMQQALGHYERMLTQSYPIYQTQLHIRAVKSKENRGMAAVILTAVSLGVIILQTSIGVFSLNVKVPTNGKTPQKPLWGFGIFITGAAFVVCIYLLFVRWLWRSAKKWYRKQAY
ncbi:hypothetical protein BDM02DRAFT_3184137 [Thelephora ganbajun]|uniref:Uncharacterized protein n=1 Tax=Thelephora ganbajun TaxID=370292 RepID=A0ACB6ZPX6_THEGA|nr:hypothetical protein BDM02DRAFT_3184137 [Thelephora ganbajun]